MTECRHRGSRLSARDRIARSIDFRNAYDKGIRFRGRFMTFWFRRDDAAAMRVGVVAGVRTGKAVQRNRARRLLREAFRLNRERLRGGGDIVLSARNTICSATYGEVDREFLELAERAGLCEDRARSTPAAGGGRRTPDGGRI